MGPSKWIKLDELRQPGMRRVLEGFNLVRSEIQKLEDDKVSVPSAHLLSKAIEQERVSHGG